MFEMKYTSSSASYFTDSGTFKPVVSPTFEAVEGAAGAGLVESAAGSFLPQAAKRKTGIAKSLVRIWLGALGSGLCDDRKLSCSHEGCNRSGYEMQDLIAQSP